MKFVVVGMPNEEVFECSSVVELLDAAKLRGWTHTGPEEQKHLLPYLQGLPKFTELAGPFGDGADETSSHQVRYETWPAYNFYSS